MNVVYSSSDLYCECTCTSIISLLENNPRRTDLHIFVLSTDISDINKGYLESISQHYHRPITVIDAKNDFVEGAKEYRLDLLRGAYNTYSRVMLNKWFRDLDRIIVIDSDTLVLGDISPLWEIDLTGKLLAAVPEIAVYSKGSTIESREILDNVELYYNMGIAVFNLHDWREKGVDEFLIGMIEKERKTNLVADQSIINRYLNNYIERLNLKFNFYSPMHKTSYKTIRKVFSVKRVFGQDEFKSAQEAPAIIHFYGHSYERPWFKHSASPYKRAYLHYRRMTKWGDAKMQKWRKPSSTILKIYDIVCYLLLRLHFYNACLRFRYVLGQRIKRQTKLKR